MHIGPYDNEPETIEKMKNYIIESEKTIDELTKKNTYLSQELDEVQTENATLKQKLSGIEANSDTSLNNLELLKRISSLEKALKKVGINPLDFIYLSRAYPYVVFNHVFT